MAPWTLIILLLLAAPPQRKSEVRLPGGKSRNLMILKDDHEKSKKDIAEIVRLAGELEREIEEHEVFVVDVKTLRKAERIEKLAKNIKNRMKRRR